MPYARPPLRSLIDQAQQDVDAARITGPGGSEVDAFLPMSIMGVLTYVLARQAFDNYAYLDWISKQSVPFTATDEFLSGWGALKGVYIKGATSTVGAASFTGAQGVQIPSGTPIVRTDGFGYVVTADTTVQPSGLASVPIAAAAPGSAGNAPAGASLVLAQPVAGVQSQGTFAGVTAPGTDQETNDQFRTRVLQRYREPPQGGARNDYIEWMLEVPGVTRAWINPSGAGAGIVSLYPMLDQSRAAYGGFPQGANGVASNEARAAPASGDLLLVADAIYPKRPVTALVYVAAPVATPVAFTVADLGADNTSATQAAIAAALQDMFLRVGNVGGTVDPDTGAPWPAIEPSAWYAALEAIPGLTSFRVTNPAGAVAPLPGYLLTLGAVTFQS